MSKGKIQVSGQVAVMSINSILAKIIFEQNPEREFYIEMSYPIDWMYPHLAPHGMILKVHRQPVQEITAAEVEKDRAYWSQQQRPLIGDWLKPETSIDEICQYVRKRHLDHNMAGFEGSAIALRCALEVIKPERMVFATDYPQNFNNSDPKQGKSIDGVNEYIDEIRRLPLDSGVKESMLGGTAARLLKW